MNSGTRYFLATAAVILLLIFGIVLIVRSDSGTPTTSGDSGTKLNDYADNTSAEVRYSIAGPIVAQENHQTIRMTVSPRTRTIEVLTGYEGQVTTTKSYENTTAAYTEFLQALTRASFTNVREEAKDINPQAICPLGNRSRYQLTDAGKNVVDLWSASCTEGTFGGNLSLTTTLFQTQFPDYSQVVNGVNLGSSSSGSRNTGLVL